MNEKKVPKTLFKYKPINEYTLASLINNTIWFPAASQLNDPFDSQVVYLIDQDIISIDDILGKFNIREGMSEDIFMNDFESSKNNLNKYIKTIQNSIGILSLSENNDNKIMWSHYSDSHKGICIEYNTASLLEKSTSIINKINYASELPQLTMSYFLNTKYTTGNDYNTEDIINILFYNKHKDWKYELEWRILNEKPGNVFLLDDAISSITFGCKAEHNMILAIHKLLSGKNIEFFEMKKIDNKLIRKPFLMTGQR